MCLKQIPLSKPGQQAAIQIDKGPCTCAKLHNYLYIEIRGLHGDPMLARISQCLVLQVACISIFCRVGCRKSNIGRGGKNSGFTA